MVLSECEAGAKWGMVSAWWCALVARWLHMLGLKWGLIYRLRGSQLGLRAWQALDCVQMVGIGGGCAAIGALERERLGRNWVPRWLRGVHSALQGIWWVLRVDAVA